MSDNVTTVASTLDNSETKVSAEESKQPVDANRASCACEDTLSQNKKEFGCTIQAFNTDSSCRSHSNDHGSSSSAMAVHTSSSSDPNPDMWNDVTEQIKAVYDELEGSISSKELEMLQLIGEYDFGDDPEYQQSGPSSNRDKTDWSE